MDKAHCKDKHLSSPARVNLGERVLAGMIALLGLVLWNSAQAKPGQYKSKGFSVVGFPSSDFGMVKGDVANPLYKHLAKASGEQPGWNFHKYLINRKGEVVGTFKSGVSPTSPQITQAIRRALDAHPITEQ